MFCFILSFFPPSTSTNFPYTTLHNPPQTPHKPSTNPLVRGLRFNDEGTWGGWAHNRECETQFPPELKEAVTPFQQLMVVSTLRPDRLLSAMQLFVCSGLGVQSISPNPLNFEKLSEEASPTTPLLFITVAGADPTQVGFCLSFCLVFKKKILSS